MAPVVSAIRQRAAGARKHSPPGVPVASAQAAAINPDTEQKRTAALQTVTNLDAAKTEKVKRNEFKSKLKDAIAKATPQPKTESAAKDVMKTGAAKANEKMREQLASERDAAAGPLKSAASTDVPAASQPEPPKADLKPEPMGAPPAPVAAAPAVPGPLPPERLDYSSDRAPTDQAMAESGVTQEQLQKGNEPEFKPSLSARETAEQHEANAEDRYRKGEAGIREQAEHVVHAEIAGGLAGMQGARSVQIGKVLGQQMATKSKHAAEHQRITETISGIKNKTRTDVEEILNSMESEAGKIFEDGLARAEKAYADTFEEAKGGAWTWLTTWGSDWEQLIESSLGKARTEYLLQVDMAIDEVADLVDAKLQAAKQRVADGRKEVETFVKSLDNSVRQFEEEALRAVSADFDAMGSEVDQRRDALVDKLAQQYKASYDRMSAMEEKLREENKTLWQRVYDATVGLIKKILAFKDMLLDVLSRAASAIGTIIAHPIDFLGNLIDAGKLGFSNFVDHITEHLKQGFMEWLFGAVAETGIQLPKDFDLPGILSLVLQVLGLTYANIRARAVKILGEKVVKALETAAEIFKILVTKGPAGLWEYIKDKIGDLKSMVIEKIKSFVMERIIMAGVTWLIGLLNPASAFFKACKAIYDIIMFFVEHGKQILDLLNAIIDSITAIAKGAIGAAAKFVETSLARTIPVIIGFLAALLGVGGISEKIKEVIEAIRKPINEAIDWVITKAVDLVKAVGGFLGFGKEKQPDSKEDPDALEVSLNMEGEEHTLAIGSVPGSPVEIASKDKKPFAVKASETIEKLQGQGESAVLQANSLKALKSKAETVSKLTTEKSAKAGATETGAKGDPKRKEALEELKKAIADYAVKFHQKDIEAKAGDGKSPAVGTYAELTAMAGKEPKDEKEPSREAHHVPERQFGETLGEAMVGAADDIEPEEGNKSGGAASALRTASANLAAKTAVPGPDLSAILIHHDTHLGGGSTPGVHRSKIREPLKNFLSLVGLKEEDVATTKSQKVVVKAGGAAFSRHIDEQLKKNSDQTKQNTPEILLGIYKKEQTRAVGAVTAAVMASKKEGPADQKAGVLQQLAQKAYDIWTNLLESLFR